MAGGPIHPFSALPITAGTTFANVHVGATNGRRVEGMGVAASLVAPATWQLIYNLPHVLPTGTPTLRLLALAAATANAAKINPTWGLCAPEENYDTVALTAEGTQTITWAGGDSDVPKEALITLDANTPLIVDEWLVMNLVFESTAWTLNVVSTWFAPIYWI